MCEATQRHFNFLPDTEDRKIAYNCYFIEAQESLKLLYRLLHEMVTVNGFNYL